MKFGADQIQAVKEFNKKVARKVYHIEDVSCLCKSTNVKKISYTDWYGLWHPVVICKDCGLLYASPRLTSESYKLFYSSDEYRRIYEGGGNYIKCAQERFNKGYGQHIFNEIYPIIKGKKHIKIMEFGCAAGWNLSPFFNEGYHVTGYDYSPSLVMLGRSRGLNLITGSFQEIFGVYDVIILNHVIEHFTDFFQSMRDVLSHLIKGGIIYIAVPDIDNYDEGQFQNAHVYYFTKRTLGYYLNLLGLRKIKSGIAQKIHMYGVYEIDKCFEPSHIDLKQEYSIMLQKVMFGKLRRFIRNLYHFVSDRFRYILR